MKAKIMMLLDNSFKSDARVEKEIESLIKANYSIDLICVKDLHLKCEEHHNDLIIRRIITSQFRRFFNKKYLLETAQKLSQFEFVAVHCHDYHMLILGAEIKRIKPETKLVYDSHEYLRGWKLYKSSLTIVNKVKGYFVWKKDLIQEKNALKNTDFIITVSSGISKQLKKDHALKSSPIVVRNFPKFQDYNYRSGDYLRNKFNIKSAKNILVHVGNIYMDQLFLFKVIKYISESRDLAIVFIGNNKSFNLNKEKYKRYENVFFHDYSSQKENIEIMAAADIGLCYVDVSSKSHLLGLANRYLEYTSSGLAVVSSAQLEILSIAEDINNIEIYNGFDSFVSALIKITENVDWYKLNSKDNYRNYVWEKEAEKIVKYYNSILQ